MCIRDSNYRYESLGYMDAIKPNGLWVSVDDDWPQWCHSNGSFENRLDHRTEIVLASDANILHLSTPEMLDRFTEEWRNDNPDWLRCIDWSLLTQYYQGLIIAPYLWERRLTPHTFWYYWWDCASGCIWDLSAIGNTEVNHVGPCRMGSENRGPD